MWNLPKGDEFLREASLQKIQKLYDNEKSAKAKIRLLGALHRKKGRSMDEIACLLSKNRRTIHSWLVRFNERGINGKDSKKAPGKVPSLTLKQRRRLIQILERGPPHNPTGLWSTKEVRELLAKKFKRIFVKQHVWRMLVSLGFSMQRPRKRHYMRASDEEITRFKKKLEGNPNIIGEKGLLWAHKMKRHSVSSP